MQLASAAAYFPDAPLALIEIGASAGLNLLWDQYGYSYGDGERRWEFLAEIDQFGA